MELSLRESGFSLSVDKKNVLKGKYNVKETEEIKYKSWFKNLI